MLISKKSLSNEKHYVTLSVDQYRDGVIKGILICGDESEGRECVGLLDFIRQMDEILEKQGIPVATVNKRVLAVEKRAEEPAKKRLNRRNGELATFIIQVQYRQNASWQGRMVHKETREKYVFRSFRQLMNQICSVLENKPLAVAVTADSAYMELLVQDLTRCLADERQSGNYLEIQQVYQSSLFCRYQYHGSNTIFAVRLKFHANSSWQGMIYWKKRRQEITFRSFLELILLLIQMVESADNAP